jgi:hypothetical protein
MMGLFGHHTKGILEIEVMGHDLGPDGPMEHVIALVITLTVVVLMSYGLYAGIRDWKRWRQQRQTSP